jgi:hypothetical protein
MRRAVRITQTAFITVSMALGVAQSRWALGADPHTASLSNETGRLEALLKSGRAKSPDRARLAQIYFLTSRCPDVLHIADESMRALTCACGGPCDAHSRLGKIMALRALLEKPTSWSDRALQSLWKEVARTPEAQHAMLRYLMSYAPARKNDGLRQLRGELESRLQSLDVQP